MDFGEEPVTRDIVQETDVGIADFLQRLNAPFSIAKVV
jgi:hypothetical protein